MKKKNKKLKWYRTEEFTLNDGEILVYRSNKSGKFWSVRIWISEEKKYYVKSLGTKDKEKSIELSKKEYRTIHNKILNGEQVFDKTVGQLCEMFLENKKELVREGDVGGGRGKHGITEGRFGTIKTQVTRHLLGYLGEKRKLSTLRNDTFENKYYKYRKKKHPNVTFMTVINERVTINNVLEFGVKKGLLKLEQLPVWEKMHKEKSRGESFTLSQWKTIYNYLRTWTKGEEDKKEIIRKEFVRHFILILCNTGLRVGEGRYLKWRDVSVEKEKDGKFTSIIDVKISKTGPRKGVIGRNGEYFNRLKSISNYTKRNDWVFVDNETGEQLGTTTLYRLWKEILENTNLKNVGNFTYYTLRHTYCTFRMKSGINIHLLSKNMGTSIAHIEGTYSHVKLYEHRHELTGGKKLTESDKVVLDF